MGNSNCYNTRLSLRFGTKHDHKSVKSFGYVPPKVGEVSSAFLLALLTDNNLAAAIYLVEALKTPLRVSKQCKSCAKWLALARLGHTVIVILSKQKNKNFVLEDLHNKSYPVL